MTWCSAGPKTFQRFRTASVGLAGVPDPSPRGAAPQWSRVGLRLRSRSSPLLDTSRRNQWRPGVLPDVFGLTVLVQAARAKLPADARLLEATPFGLRHVGVVVVDPDRAVAQPAGDPLGPCPRPPSRRRRPARTSVSLASRTASSSVVKRSTVRTGPKTSSRTIAMSRRTSAKHGRPVEEAVPGGRARRVAARRRRGARPRRCPLRRAPRPSPGASAEMSAPVSVRRRRARARAGSGRPARRRARRRTRSWIASSTISPAAGRADLAASA